MERVDRNGLRIAAAYANFVEDAALPGTGISPAAFWDGLSRLVDGFEARRRALLAERAALQAQIDAWHVDRRGRDHDPAAYRAFLEEIGYLVPPAPAFSIETANVDPEIASVPGPQLVVPVMNARYALNAANARWGSLYDALYGTDALGDLPAPGSGYDADRGARVVARAKAFLDQSAPLAGGSWAEVTRVDVQDGMLIVDGPMGETGLADPAQFVGVSRDQVCPLQIILAKNGLHVDVRIDPSTPVGSADPAGIADVRLESAITTIMDCEDSVAAVDAEDKVLAYGNWLGLMKGDLTTEVTKAGRTFRRALAADVVCQAPGGAPLTLKGRSLMLVRNVGLLMTNPTALTADGEEIGECLLDALTTVMIAKHDLARDGGNSVTGSIYVVEPKLHGPAEVAFVNEMMGAVEDILSLPRDTVKIGIMDEERRTTVNLAACIHAARTRVAFINTGFLDRTGDEIHTAMEAGPMIRKGAMKATPWIAAYEDANVSTGLACGLSGKAQIGKGMWAMPDRMAEMLETKVGHPMAGANCAWVPSPTAATLHATHYHAVDVFDRQRDLAGRDVRLDDILTLPLATAHNWSDDEIRAEMDNNAQGILGYVVRWVDQGIGCSKVPDIHDVGLMEDRATCRISAQHMANWLHHGIVDRDRVMETMQRMAAVVDTQNAGDPAYQPMAPGFDGPAFQAAVALVLDGTTQPSGYTEPILHAQRRVAKAAR